MKKSILYEKALLQILGEDIGFDEAKIYLGLLFCKDGVLNLYSLSKTYRILQRLFEGGYLFKIKIENKAHYLPVPPSFLYSNNLIDFEAVEYLEKEYIKNHLETIKQKLMIFEANGESLEGLIIFLVKYLMKKEGILILGGPDILLVLKKFLPEKIKFLRIFGRKDYFKNYTETINENLSLIEKEIISNRRLLLIDESILLEVLKLPNKEYMGYVTTDPLIIKLMKEELQLNKY